MIKRILYMLILCLTFTFPLNGCSNSQVDSKAISRESPVTITIGIWPDDSRGSEKSAYQEYKSLCEKKYPYITIVPDPYHYSPETFVVMAESGQLPTVYQTWFTEPQKIIACGYAADITQIMKQYGYDKDMKPTILSMLSKDGKIYGIPRDGYALGLYLNMDLFREAGLVDKNGLPDYPVTFAELAKTAQIIREKTGKAGMFFPTKDNVGGWHFTQLAWAFGAQFEKKQDGKWIANFNTPQAVAALQYVKDLKWKYDVLLPQTSLNWGDWIKDYGTGQVAMVFAAPDYIDAPTNDYKMSKDSIAIVPVPKGPGGQFSLMGGTLYMFASNASKEQIDAAFKFLDIAGVTSKADEKSLSGLEIMLMNRAKGGVAVGPRPLQLWINKDRLHAEDAIYNKYTNVNMEYFRHYDEVSVTNLRLEEPYYTQDLYAILDTVVQAVISDKDSDPKVLLDNANSEFQKKFMDLNK